MKPLKFENKSIFDIVHKQPVLENNIWPSKLDKQSSSDIEPKGTMAETVGIRRQNVAEK